MASETQDSRGPHPPRHPEPAQSCSQLHHAIPGRGLRNSGVSRYRAEVFAFFWDDVSHCITPL
eukprot:13102576-Alexandrium_andersonii.AAC.1